jgi:septal ring factor EnvC (AmiA/AmiB activator)
LGAKQGKQMNPILQKKLENLEVLMRECDHEREQLQASANTIEQKLKEAEYRKMRLAKQYAEVTMQLSIPMLNPIGAY